MEVGEMKDEKKPQVEVPWVPWVPSTPVKPILQNTVPICSPGQGNQPQLPHHDNGAVACSKFISFVEQNKMPCIGSVTEAATENVVGGNGKASVETISGGTTNFGQMGFCQLMLMQENVAFLNLNAAQLSNGPINPCFTLDSQFKANIGMNNTKNTQVTGTSYSNQEDEEKNNSILEFAAVCTPLEVDSLQQANNNEADLNKTPQQKQRRRKHRPKVIVEDKPKRTRKPTNKDNVQPKENSTGKRKYVRKKGVDKTHATPEETTDPIEDKELMPKFAKKSCRRTLFDGVRKEEFAGREDAIADPHKDDEAGENMNLGLTYGVTQVRSTTRAKPKESQPVKRKYTRKRTSNNSAPGSEGTTILTEEIKLESTKIHCQSSSKFDGGDKNVSNNNMMSLEDAQGPLQSSSSNNMPEEVQDPWQGSFLEVQPIGKSINKRRGGRRKKMNKSCSTETTMEFTEPMIPARSRIQKKSRKESSTGGEKSNACISKENNMMTEEMFVSKQNPYTQQGLKDFWISLPIDDTEAQNSSSKDNSIEVKQREKQTKGRAYTAPTAAYDQNINMNQVSVAFDCDQNSHKNSISYNDMSADHTKAHSIFPPSHETKLDVNCKLEEDGNRRNDQTTVPRGQLSQMADFKRKHSDSLEHPDTSGKNIIGTQYNDLCSYQTGCWQFSDIQKKSKKKSKSVTGSTSNISVSSTSREVLLACPQEHARYLAYPGSNVIINSGYNGFCLMLESPKDSTPHLKSSDIDAVAVLANLFRELNINAQENALIPYKQKKRKQKHIIFGDGTIIPIENSLVHVKKQYPRPRVDIDEETDRVWKLLMLDINSPGIDGIDEDKARWWKEQRNMFRGKADAFIAKMHLIQGDRRFSRWKGSVVDSVVGVFLTQNVSDHLSSSAFMALAARFPKQSTSTNKSSEEGTSLAVKEPQVLIVEPEESTECDAKTLNQSIHDQSSITIEVNEDSREEEVVNDSCKTTSCVSSLTDESQLQELSPRKNEEKEEKLCYECVKAELNDPVSSQSSVISCPISRDFSNDHDHEKIGSWSDSNSEVEDLSSITKYNHTSLSTHLEKLTDASRDSMDLKIDHGVLKNKEENGKSILSYQGRESGSQVVISHSQGIVDPINPWEQSNCTSQSLFNISGQSQDPPQRERQIDHGAHKNAAWNGTNEASSMPRKFDIKAKGKEKKDEFNWDSLRIEAQAKAGKREKTENTMDSLDWDAVRTADVSVISDVIKERGMNNRLAERIQDFLNRLVEQHGDIDLEWLRDVPPDKAKEYLLSVRGLGLKSVECVRLLTLHHLAFPVDTNVGRIAVRLGWVPLQPLPESLQLHLLELYPILESIQKYLWPRLCKLDQRTLYELHYQMITFGKVFCTKTKPNCNACPMRADCRHFASAFASARLTLPAPEPKSIVPTTGNNATNENPTTVNISELPLLENANQGAEILQAESISETNVCHPIIEEPKTPEPECSQVTIPDIEDAFWEDSSEIPTIKFNMERFTENVQDYMQGNMSLQEGEMSKALVALTPEAANIPMPKLKNVSRLRTEHWVYELPDTHPLLEGWDKRETDDPGKYLLAIWTPGETANSVQPPESKCSYQETGQLCNEKECLSCNSVRESNSQTVRGTILIPCRTATQGSFPLNGTYFQVNEVFADHESSMNPISVPRDLIWNLRRRTVYFGTSVTSILRGFTTPEIQLCFWRGFVCVRGFDRATRAPRPLQPRLHLPASKMPKTSSRTPKTYTRTAKTSSKTAKTPGTTRKRSTTPKSKGAKTKPEQPEVVSDSHNIQKGENPKENAPLFIP